MDGEDIGERLSKQAYEQASLGRKTSAWLSCMTPHPTVSFTRLKPWGFAPWVKEHIR